MIFILGLLAKFSIVVFFGGIIFSSVSDLIMKTTYLEDLDNLINLGDTKVAVLLGILSLIYLIVFLLSYINKWTKYSQNRKIKDKNSEIEVTIKTINDVSKEFLSHQNIIKNVKVKSFPKGKSGVVIEGIIDTYNVENLSEKLNKIQNDLAKYVEKSTGIEVKKSILKVKKILPEPFNEKLVFEETTIKNDDILKKTDVEIENVEIQNVEKEAD